jgi:hypothetical protein
MSADVEAKLSVPSGLDSRSSSLVDSVSLAKLTFFTFLGSASFTRGLPDRHSGASRGPPGSPVMMSSLIEPPVFPALAMGTSPITVLAWLVDELEVELEVELGAVSVIAAGISCGASGGSTASGTGPGPGLGLLWKLGWGLSCRRFLRYSCCCWPCLCAFRR